MMATAGGGDHHDDASTTDLSTTTLDRLPDTRALLARAAFSLTPGLRSGSARSGLPGRELVVAGVRQDLDRYAAYSRVCGRGLRDEVLPTWLHILTFPLQLDLMTARDFPFPAVGLVHVENRMRVHRPVRAIEELTLSVHAADLREHRAGAQFDLRERVSIGEELVWEGVSTYLARGVRLGGSGSGQDGGDVGVGGDGGDVGAADGTGSQWSSAEPEALAQRALWRVDGRDARDYAAQSGDYNPIHMNPIAAKAFGFPRTIAHGMYSHARALAWLEPRLPEAYVVTASFKKPLLLPATIAFRAARDGATRASGGAQGEAWRYAVTSRDGSRTHLLGGIEVPE